MKKIFQLVFRRFFSFIFICIKYFLLDCFISPLTHLPAIYLLLANYFTTKPTYNHQSHSFPHQKTHYMLVTRGIAIQHIFKQAKLDSYGLPQWRHLFMALVFLSKVYHHQEKTINIFSLKLQHYQNMKKTILQ